MDTSSHSSRAGEHGQDTSGGGLNSGGGGVVPSSSIVNLYEDVVAGLEGRRPRQQHLEEGSGSGSQPSVLGSPCSTSSTCIPASSDQLQCSGGGGESGGGVSGARSSRDRQASAAVEERQKDHQNSPGSSSNSAVDSGLLLDKKKPPRKAEEEAVGMASSSTSSKTQEEEEKEALEQQQSPEPPYRDKELEAGVQQAATVEATTDSFWGGGFLLQHCPTRIVGLINTMRQRDQTQNKHRRRCLIYAVAIAGLLCLTLVLGVVIWRCTWDTAETSGGTGGEAAAGQLRQEGVVGGGTLEEGEGAQDGLHSTPSRPPSVVGPDTRALQEPHLEVRRFSANGSDHFKILHTDTLSDSILVGAKNMVYNISMHNQRQLTINKKIEWHSESYVVEICRSRRKSEEACQNYIRVIVNQTGENLFVCGTNAFKPECRTYRSTPSSYEKIDSKSGMAICPYEPSQNNTFTYADGDLYTGTIADVSGRDSLIYRYPTRTVQHDSQMLNNPDFVGSFEHGDNVYFFFREFAVEYINCGKAIYSRVGRVCKKDQGGQRILRNIWTSFFKARLNCSIPGDFPFYFDEIQSTSNLGQGFYKPITDISNRTDMIYAVFNTPENSISGSAVCAFRMADLIAAFEGGFKEQKSVYSTWLPVNEADTPKPHPAQCVNNSKELPIQTQNWIKSHPLMDRAVQSFGGRPLLVQTSLTSRMTQIAVDWQRQAVDGTYYDILFIGTNDGKVIKAINRGTGSNIDSMIIEEIQVFGPGHPVTGLQVYHSEKPGQEFIEKLIVVSRSEIKTIPLHRCNHQQTCGACVSLRDPYCSWDSNKCRAHTQRGKQNIVDGTGCGPSDKSTSDGSVVASSASSSAPTSPPCVCPEQRVGVHPTVDSQRGASSTTTDDKDANRVEDGEDTSRDNENAIPNVGSLSRKGPEIGASTQVRGDTVSASTLAISLVFAILIALIVGFFAGYRTSVYRHKGHQDDFFMSTSPKNDGLKNLNRFEDTNCYNTHDYLPQPRNEKQLNVVFNPLKPNSKLPNGSAQTEVQKQKARKVYL